jgi:two-component system, cell cycle sensor histidine kinase PleC
MTSGVEDGDAPDYRLRPLSLRFSDARLERRFVTEHLARSLPAIRVFLLAGAALYAVFGILDVFIVPEIRAEAWLIRYAAVCPLMLAVLALTFTPVFARLAQVALAAAFMAAGLGIVAMTALAEAPGNGLYYAGLVVVLVYGASLIRLRWVYAAFISLGIVALYQAVAVWISPIPLLVLVNNDFFLAMSVATGLFSGYVQELFLRRDFVSNEQIRWEKRLADALRREAESANRAKSEFFAIISHELRTPLNAILGFAQIMQQGLFGPVGNPRYAVYVDDIDRAANHLLGVIGDVLDLSKAEAGKLTLREEQFELAGIIDQAMRLLRERAAEQGLRLSLQLPREGGYYIRGDERLLKQVLLNLLGNAIKFTPAGGSVTVVAGGDAEGGCSVRVADTGIGIAEADLPRVLQPFVQVESVFARKHGGTGLGLPLVKQIMELHGGGVEIDSALGAGTAVTVRLPPSRVALMPAQVANVA